MPRPHSVMTTGDAVAVMGCGRGSSPFLIAVTEAGDLRYDASDLFCG